MLLSCQICQCIKGNPGKNGHKSHSKTSYLSGSKSGELFWLLCFQFLFFCSSSSIRSASVHTWSQLKKQRSLWKGDADPSHELEREYFLIPVGDSPALLLLPHLPLSVVKTSPSIRDLTNVEIYEMRQKSQSCRSWDSSLNCTTIPASLLSPSCRQQHCQTLIPLPAPLLHLLGAKHPLMPSKHFQSGEHLSCEKWAKSFQ